MVIAPTSWANYNQTIFETIKITDLQTAAVYFDKPYSLGAGEKDTIFVTNKIKSFSGKPINTIKSAIDHIANS